MGLVDMALTDCKFNNFFYNDRLGILNSIMQAACQEENVLHSGTTVLT